MKKSTSVNTRPRWKRSAETGTLVGVRFQADQLAAIDKAAKALSETRPEAIRRLVELGLTVQPAKKATAKAAARAADLAAEAIDKHLDPKASVEHRNTAKRRLLKGPSAFRDIRKDGSRKRS